MRAFLFLALAAPMTALAGGGGGEVEVGVAGGLLVSDPLETLGNGWTVLPRGSYSIRKGAAVEVEVPIAMGKTNEFERSYVMLAPRVMFRGSLLPDRVVDPILTVGAGALYKNVKDAEPFGTTFANPDLDLQLMGGPGLRIPIGQMLVVRTDYRFILSVGGEPYARQGDTFLNWEWTAGVSFRFGGAKDSDRDRVPDEDDGCPNEKEDRDGFADDDGCPEPDNDNDGFLDADDQCPTDAEDKDEFQDDDGCPDDDNDNDGVRDINDLCPLVAGTVGARGCPDRDGDNIDDERDACPDVAGELKFSGCVDSDGDGVGDNIDECTGEAGPENAGGCPDKDGDTVGDAKDKCPDEAGHPDLDRRYSDGCKTRVYISTTGVVLTDQAAFDRGRGKLKSTYNAVLDEAAALINQHTDLEVIEVGVHTDDRKDEDKNVELSDERAKAIVTYLTETGKVDAARLTTKGYGTSATGEGQEADRIVLTITKRKGDETAPADQEPAPEEGGEAPAPEETPKDEGEKAPE